MSAEPAAGPAYGSVGGSTGGQVGRPVAGLDGALDGGLDGGLDRGTGHGTDGGWDDGWDADTGDRLFRALLAFDGLHDREFFGLVVRETAVRLGGDFSVPHHAEARTQLTLLVETVRVHRDPDGVLRALARTLRKQRGDTAAMLRLDALVDELAPPGRLPGPQLRAIVAALQAAKRPIPPAAASAALERAARPGEPRAVRGDESVPAMVRRLNDAREPADLDGTDVAAPLVLRFLAELARALPAGTADLLRGHVAVAADELGLPPQVRHELTAHRDPVRTRAAHRVLQIRFSQTAPDKQEYEVEGVLFDRTDSGLRGPRKRAGTRAYGVRDLKDLGRTCLLDWEDLAAGLDEADRAQVEFLLPWSLLGHPVERWLTDAHGYLVGHKYPVVVRSLDRIRQRSWHRDWERRWRALQHWAAAGCASGRVGWLVTDPATALAEDCDAVHVRGRDGEIRGWLDAHPDAAGMALAFAYDHRDARHSASVREAVCEGVPFMVWRRDDGDPAELALRLGEYGRPGGPGGSGGGRSEGPDMPTRMQRWRRGAARDDIGDMRNHLTLFWDDPECVHRESAFVVPGTPALEGRGEHG